MTSSSSSSSTTTPTAFDPRRAIDVRIGTDREGEVSGKEREAMERDLENMLKETIERILSSSSSSSSSS